MRRARAAYNHATVLFGSCGGCPCKETKAYGSRRARDLT
jgi:hypothetical protein